MTVDPMSSPRFAGPPQALAANADLERAIDVLKAGSGMALTGLILGWGAIALIIMLAVLVITVSTHSTHGVVIHPGPSFPAFPGGPGGLLGAGG